MKLKVFLNEFIKADSKSVVNEIQLTLFLSFFIDDKI